MRVRRSSVVFGGLGVLLIAAAVVLRFVIVPIATRLPAGTNLLVHYAGTATLLNPRALASGDPSKALESGVPIIIDRRTRVLSTLGNVAIVSDAITLHAGATSLPNTHLYAVNRSSLEATTAPSGQKVEPASGLTVSFPTGPKPDNSYRYYDATTELTVAVAFKGPSSSGGRGTYSYAITANGPVKDKNLLATLPQSLPKKTLASLAPLLPVSLRQSLAPELATLPDPVPLTYTAKTHITAQADKTTGIAITETLNETVTVQVSVAGKAVSLVPVLAIDATVTPGSVRYLAGKASSAARLLFLLKSAAPLSLLILGLVSLVVAILRRRPASPANLGSQSAPNVASAAERPDQSQEAG